MTTPGPDGTMPQPEPERRRLPQDGEEDLGAPPSDRQETGPMFTPSDVEEAIKKLREDPDEARRANQHQATVSQIALSAILALRSRGDGQWGTTFDEKINESGGGPSGPEFDTPPGLTVTFADKKSYARFVAAPWAEVQHLADPSGLVNDYHNLHQVEFLAHEAISRVTVATVKNPKGTVLIGAIKPDKHVFTPQTSEQFKSYIIDQLYRHFGAAHEAAVRVKPNGDEVELLLENGQKMCVRVRADFPVHLSFPNTATNSAEATKQINALEQELPKIAEIVAHFWDKPFPQKELVVKTPEAFDKKVESATPMDEFDRQRLAQLEAELRQASSDPDLRLEHIGGLSHIVKKFESIAKGMQHPEVYKRWGTTQPKGILLTGAPGTGKTMIAEAFANHLDGVFLKVKPSTIDSVWAGSAEKNARDIFTIARRLSEEEEQLVVVFLDELEQIAPHRGHSIGSIQNKVTGELLQQLNQDYPGVLFIAATNMPQQVDPALIRSQRFSQHIEVPLPDHAARMDILNKSMARPNQKAGRNCFMPDIDVAALANECQGFSGADIQEIVDEALRQKAEIELEGGTPTDVSHRELIQAVKEFAAQKDNVQGNYLS